MARNSEVSPDQFEYKIIDPRDPDPPLIRIRKQRQAMDRLIQESLEYDYPDRLPPEIAHAMKEIATTELNPNNAVGGLLLKQRQSYAHNRSILAIKDGELSAFLATADNASSRRRPIPLGLAEQQFKLKFERQIEHRWRWLGIRVMAEEVRPRPGEYDPTVLSVLDVLGYIAVKLGDERQPVSAYPWQGEKLWTETLESWGLQPHDDEQPKSVYAFGIDKTPVQQKRWTAENAAAVMNAIEAKTDTEVLDCIDLPIYS